MKAKKQSRAKKQRLIKKTIRSKKNDTQPETSQSMKMSIAGIPKSWTKDTRISLLLKNPKSAGSSAFERYQQYKHARTIQEALDNGAFAGDLAHDFRRSFLKRAQGKTDSQAFKFVVSLGSRCLVADVLRDQGLRRFASPFDWIYSSSEMVTHCLRDNFKTLLDKKLIFKSGHAYGHRFYGPMLSRGVVFPHHDPGGKDRADFEKRIHRMRQIISGRQRKLFIFSNVIQSAESLRQARSELAKQELLNLFQALLKRGVSNFEVLVVNLICGGASEALRKRDPVTKLLSDQNQKSRDNSLAALELHCVGECTGLRLKNSKDNEAFSELILGDRNFDLAPDPLQDTTGGKPSSSVLHPKLSVKRDSDGNWRPKKMD